MGTISNTIATGITLTVSGTYASPLTIAASGYIDNPGSGSAIIGPGIQAWTVINYGRVIASEFGIGFGSGGLVSNSGTIIASQIGVSIGPAGTVINSGTISATGASAIGVELFTGSTLTNAAGGLISGGVEIFNGPGSITNSGTITEFVQLLHGGLVNNTSSGLIADDYGVYIGAIPGTVANAGTIEATGTNNLFGSGIRLSAGGTVINSGTVDSATGTAISFGGIAANRLVLGPGYHLGGTVVGAGYGATNTLELSSAASIGTLTAALNYEFVNFSEFSVDSGAQWVLSTTIAEAGTQAHTLSNSGTILGPVTVGNFGILDNTAIGTITGSGSSGIGVVLGGSWSTLSNAGTLIGAQTAVSFEGAGDLLIIHPGAVFGGVIAGFTVGDAIDFAAVTYSAGLTGSIASGTLTVSNGTTALAQLAVSGIADGTSLTLAADAGGGTHVMVACFCRGTLILTPDGEVPVEDLAIGDRVVTLGNDARPIRWIGYRAYDGRFIVGNRAVLPIRIAAGALDEFVPAHDLWVSPEHSLYIDGVLVQAKHLVNGATIAQAEAVAEVEYFHIELDTHDIIFADGAPSETCVDCDNRLMFANVAEFERLYPQDDRPRWEFCAPRREGDSDELTAIRAALSTRAEALGYRLDCDPDPYLVVDGERIAPDAVAQLVYRFTVPAGGRAVWLASRSAVPADAGAQDLRRVGVPIERILLHDDDLLTEIQHGYPGFCDGFHPDEDGHRWTDGMARLPENLIRPFRRRLHP